MENKGKGLINFAERYSRIILFAIKLLIVVSTLYSLKLRMKNYSSDSLNTSVKLTLV